MSVVSNSFVKFRSFPLTGISGANLVGLLLLLVTGVLWAWAQLHPNSIEAIAMRGSYYLMFALFALWVVASVRMLSSRFHSMNAFLRQYGFGLVTALFFCSLAFLASKPQLKVLDDEANLLNVSKSMAFEKTGYATSMGQRYHDNFYPIARLVDKRPFFFPFLVSLFHGLLGYRAQHIFVVNFLLLFLFLSVVFCLALRPLSALGAVGLQSLIMSQPLLLFCATSGGFDLAATVFLVVGFAGLWSYYKNQDTQSLNFLLSTLLVYSQIRYEGFAFVFLILVLSVVTGHITFKTIGRQWWFLGFASLLLLIQYWHFSMVPAHFLDPREDVTTPFSLQHLIPMAYEFWGSITNLEMPLPYSPFLYAISLGSVLLFVKGTRWKMLAFRSPIASLSIVIASCSLFHLLMMFCYFQGFASHPVSARFYLWEVCLLACLPVVGVVINPKLPRWLPLGLGVMTSFLYWPVVTDQKYLHSLFSYRMAKTSLNFLERQPSKALMVVTDRPAVLTAHDYGAINFEYANENPEMLFRYLNTALVENVFFIQRISVATGSAIDKLTPTLQSKLQPLKEEKLEQDSLLRISRLIPTK